MSSRKLGSKTRTFIRKGVSDEGLHALGHEGVSGLFTREHVWFWEEGVRQDIADEGRRLLMADVNSATAAALEAGAEQVIVCDTHHGGGNIIVPEMLADPRVTYHGPEPGDPRREAPLDAGPGRERRTA